MPRAWWLPGARNGLRCASRNRGNLNTEFLKKHRFCGTAGVVALALLTACSRPEVKAAKYLERGNEFFERKDFARAVLEYKNAIQAQPGQAEGHYRMALV